MSDGQSLKYQSSIDVIKNGISISNNDEQHPNEFSSIDCDFEDDENSQNAPFLIVVTEFGIIISINDLHLLNAND